MPGRHHAPHPVSPLFDAPFSSVSVDVAPPQRIEQAKGVLMTVFGLDADAAHALLVQTAGHCDDDLTVVADRFLDGAAAVVFGPGPVEGIVRALAGLPAVR